jgi:hypothetical protein
MRSEGKKAKSKATVIKWQSLCWNFLYHSRITFYVGGSVWYLVRNFRCTVTNFQDPERSLIPCPRHVSSRLPRSGETCKYAMTRITQKNLGRFSTYSYDHFCCVCFDCCPAEFGSSGKTYELPCITQTTQYITCCDIGRYFTEVLQLTNCT